MASIEELEEEAKEKVILRGRIDDLQVRRVRHGNGINLFGKTKDGLLCKYEGQWEKDQKCGEGFMVFPDSARYRGNFKNDNFEGYGKYEWPKGYVYEGNWKDGRMDGGGEFTRPTGKKLKGLFKNNYYNDVSTAKHKPVQDNKRFLNPFLSDEELKKFVAKSEEFSQTTLKEKVA